MYATDAAPVATCSLYLHPDTGHLRAAVTLGASAPRFYSSSGPAALPVALEQEGADIDETAQAWAERGYRPCTPARTRHLVATACLVADHVRQGRPADAVAVLWASDVHSGGWRGYGAGVRTALVWGVVDLWTDRDATACRQAAADIWRAVYGAARGVQEATGAR